MAMAMAGAAATSSASTLRRRKKISPSPSFDSTSRQGEQQLSAQTTKRSTVFIIISSLFMLSTCAKILLIPAYKSTDFDVHRHWKAVTQHLPVTEWYFDDQHVQTFHTLDYPPGFAWFEYIWSNYYVYLYKSLSLSVTGRTLLLENERCLSLLTDTDNDVSATCVMFMRSTVILSDVILWLGAGAIAWTATVGRLDPAASTSTSSERSSSPSQMMIQSRRCWTIFLLIVAHPGLLWLDHVHFQYNGMLLGILLLSLACLLQANNMAQTNNTQLQINNTRRNTQTSVAFHGYHLAAAVLFAILLTLKHLYLILAPWYFCYLLQRYVLMTSSTPPTTRTYQKQQQQQQWKGCVQRLLILGVVTLVTLILPVVPFLVMASESSSPQQQLTQMAARLFPFSRGLVHDYWAGNVWALHQAVNKLLHTVPTRLLPDWLILPDVSPGQCAVLLLLSLLPGCWQAVLAAAEQNNERLVLSVTYSALASFLTAYHVHEKAILTSLLPLTVWAVGLATATRQDIYNNHNKYAAAAAAAAAPLRLLTQTTAAAVLGLGPLLFRPVEMLLKVLTLTPYLAVLVHLCQCECESDEQEQSRNNMITTQTSARKPPPESALLEVLGHICQPHQHPPELRQQTEPTQPESLQQTQTWLYLYWHHWLWWWASVAWIVPVWALVELVPVRVWGRYEFVPLAVTSVSVAVTLLVSFAKITYRMVSIQAQRKPKTNSS